MRTLDAIRNLVEWAISGLCLFGSAALFIQQDWPLAMALFVVGLGLNPSIKANPILKACLTFMAFIVLFSE